METNLLKYIFVVHAYRLGSLSKTAELCNYTQPYVSKTIQRFEDEIGIKIFERYKHGVRVRKEALPTVQLIEAFIDSYNQFLEVLSSQQIHRRVTVGVTASFASFHMPVCIKDFSLIHPNIEIQLKVGTYTEIENMIETSTVDFGITSLPMRKTLSSTFLMDEPDVVICNKTHPLAKRGIFLPDSFQGETLIATREGDDKYIRELYEHTESEPETIRLINDDRTVIYMVSQGLGISVLPQIMAQEHTDRIAMLDFSDYLIRKIGIGVQSGKQPKKSALLLIDFLIERFKTP